MGFLDEQRWGLWMMWDADPGQSGKGTPDKEIEPDAGTAGCMGGISAPSPPGLQEQGRMLLELLQAALLPGLPSPFPLPL